jgi:ATP-dependent Lon protease
MADDKESTGVEMDQIDAADEQQDDAQLKQGENNILKIPVLTLNGVIVFPFALTPLVIDGEVSINLVEQAVAGERLVGLFPEMPPANSIPPPENGGVELKVNRETFDGKEVSEIGVLGRIVKMLKFPDGTVRVLVRGLSRVKLVTQVKESAPPSAIVERIQEEPDSSLETVATARNAVKQFQEIISYSSNFPEELKIAILNLTDNVRIVDLISDTINISYVEKLGILTAPTLQERLQLLTILLNREVEVLKLGSEIQTQVHNAMSKSQREFFLREQLKTIKEELGEGSKNPDIEAINERVAKLKMPEKVLAVVKKETERLEMIPQASAEYNVAFTYIDWLLSVPWGVYTEDRIDVASAARMLDRDHYGLKDVKERILEFLAVLQLKKDRKAPIICFVGPPGVGKTSLGQSIAKAMGRNFVRMSLGGIKDEAEIRGHRRTYVGALPGRIIQGLKKAGSANPVFMLDEIDKVGNDFRGDPASALLEVLDPAQNSAFNDHYLELDYDLSSVMFIATANITDSIPAPLLDRMDVIRLPGYTAMEKRQIATRFLIPRQLKENGLKRATLSFKMDAVDELINHYTREAGVRTLERNIGSAARKIARKIVGGEIEQGSATKLGAEGIRKLLGPRKFIMDEAIRKAEVGVATGMAWTSVGGSILPVEATSMPGRGDLKLTGSLGDVMKESAITAFSFIKSHVSEFGIDPSAFKRSDFHVHVPDGATPKDGPSAGITITTALISLLSSRPVRPLVAMTGEITLRGRVTAVGGIKEKVIAALRAGIKEIILPKENEKDLEDIPDEVRRKLEFHFAERAADALELVLPPQPRKAKARAGR